MLTSSVPQYVQSLSPFSYMGGVENPGNEKQALETVAAQFEALFIGEMLKQMRNTTFESGLFGNDRASKIYRDMHDEAMAMEMARTGAFGIGKMMLQELGSAAETRKAYAASAAKGA